MVIITPTPNAQREERLADRGDHDVPADQRKVRHEQEPRGLAGAAVAHREDQQADQDQKAKRCQDPGHALDALVDAEADHEGGGGDEEARARQHGDGAVHHRSLHLRGAFGVDAGKTAGDGQDEVVQHPAADHEVEAQDQEDAGQREPAERLPRLADAVAFHQHLHVAHHAAPADAAQQHLGHQRRDGQHHQCDEVQRHEQAAAVDPGQVAELPDVGDARLGTDGSDQEQQVGRPGAACGGCDAHRVTCAGRTS
ncbi:hypothetical protein QE383_000051 [Pseudoxanthomonas winnipegensis]|uniref:Uncharacterized protein n=1 Tax=Pseudoxanthomonas winnipegensis TaxID=2480810 RepID=A0AAW8G873_9GAMM|nr:hypothetical protein [Pseudoxanthomonas winnipegensis]MDQ1117743.1 hypothetical protein [Pseudoxanthomonas winnipegensis]